MQIIDTVNIMQKAVSDSDVLSYYELVFLGDMLLVLSDAELVPERHVSKDILRSMVILYVRVRAFSLAKDLIQRYKIKAKLDLATSDKQNRIIIGWYRTPVLLLEKSFFCCCQNKFINGVTFSSFSSRILVKSLLSS